ncbi:VOC family protein [Pseudooceanicola sp. CBS1P-1]|uniref:VOC family protein n=1 Tax=Pseudooceanicola albus TaxID=2692189 RepID=A0A6L7G9M6_9RHOB|nr:MULTISPECIES: VOC family protein [Pseudooceanicola]MBT9386323.1 VOC family protein [Pseudooceanicola endophyticus]MXN20372.1 VOC family protein [Pseudooceanicola albus]
MKIASLRYIARDIQGLVAFYETITGRKADWLAPVFAEIVTPSVALAFGTQETVALFAPGSAEAGANRSVILELQVADLEAEFARLKALDVVHPPKDLPWGNRTFQLRDPEGNLVSFYMPVTEVARARFGQR